MANLSNFGLTGVLKGCMDGFRCNRVAQRGMHEPTPHPLPPLGRTEPMATLKLIIYCWLVFAGNGLLRFLITVDDNR